MAKPEIADTQPIEVNLEAGETYYWCACGRSNSQPFCDGSHAGTEFEPDPFTVIEDGPAWLCQCKRTKNPPFCDGSHAQIDPAELSASTPASEPGFEPGAELASEAANNTTGSPSGAVNVQPTAEEPTLKRIHQLAMHGLSQTGHHGEMVAMGVPRNDLPHWDDIQLLTAQFARKPLLDNAAVGTELVIGPNAKKPLQLQIPLFVSDMSFGALSEEAKLALAQGAELAGTGICSGEGGMLPEEQEANSRYFYELASAGFGFDETLLTKVQAFHFKGGQAAKTGTGGHLPGAKVTEKIAQVRGLEPGQDAVSPATFTELRSPEDFKYLSDRVREVSGGIPIGMKLSANHIEDDIDFALAAGVDYLILDGRGGGTGAAPRIFRDHISVPTIPALARARHHLDQQRRDDVTLIVTGGLRVAEDFAKAMALGADGVALANSAMQAIGCIGARMCNSNNCPAGIATQKPELRARLDVDDSALRLQRYLQASVQLMQVLARACGHDHLSQFNPQDLTSWKKDIAELAGIRYAGMGLI